MARIFDRQLNYKRHGKMINFSKRPPSVSVVMPVCNGAKYLVEAIKSIVNQSFTDFEFIIVDDGSTDRTVEIIHSFRERRIVLIENSDNLGNYPSRNIGMELARGKYICVMDADDISLKHRLERQFYYMETNPDVGICGSFIQTLPSGNFPKFITDNELLKVAFLSNNQCSHPSLMLRKSLLLQHQVNYNQNYCYSADFDLCARGFRYFKIHNLPEVLLQYRHHPGQISTAWFSEQQKFADAIRIQQLVGNLGFERKQVSESLHLKLMRREPIRETQALQAKNWIRILIDKNRSFQYYEESRLSFFLNSLLKVNPI
jgi:glycosyltransferase involved in cell wall biosynthesis